MENNGNCTIMLAAHWKDSDLQLTFSREHSPPHTEADRWRRGDWSRDANFGSPRPSHYTLLPTFQFARPCRGSPRKEKKPSLTTTLYKLPCQRTCCRPPAGAVPYPPFTLRWPRRCNHHYTPGPASSVRSGRCFTRHSAVAYCPSRWFSGAVGSRPGAQVRAADSPITRAPSAALPTHCFLIAGPHYRTAGDIPALSLCPPPPGIPRPLRAELKQGDPGSIPGRAIADFRVWESCRTMPLVGGFSQGSPVSSAISFRRRSILTSIALTGSQALDVQSRPNLFTHSPGLISGEGPPLPSFPAPILHVGIVPDDAIHPRIFSWISCLSHPCIPALLHTHLTLIGSQDYDAKSRPNLFTPLLCNLRTRFMTLTSQRRNLLPSGTSTNSLGWLCERAILILKTAKLLQGFEGVRTESKHVDTVVCGRFITSRRYSASSFFLVCQHHAPGTPVLSLRRLNPPERCGVTRLRVGTLRRNVIEAMVFTACVKGRGDGGGGDKFSNCPYRARHLSILWNLTSPAADKCIVSSVAANNISVRNSRRVNLTSQCLRGSYNTSQVCALKRQTSIMPRRRTREGYDHPGPLEQGRMVGLHEAGWSVRRITIHLSPCTHHCDAMCPDVARHLEYILVLPDALQIENIVAFTDSAAERGTHIHAERSCSLWNLHCICRSHQEPFVSVSRMYRTNREHRTTTTPGVILCAVISYYSGSHLVVVDETKTAQHSDMPIESCGSIFRNFCATYPTQSCNKIMFVPVQLASPNRLLGIWTPFVGLSGIQICPLLNTPSFTALPVVPWLGVQEGEGDEKGGKKTEREKSVKREEKERARGELVVPRAFKHLCQLPSRIISSSLRRLPAAMLAFPRCVVGSKLSDRKGRLELSVVCGSDSSALCNSPSVRTASADQTAVLRGCCSVAGLHSHPWRC
ncbi:hypothetical protein PR048_018541 [Dryococelus australis]|uniref:Uncharacterized protein n=1 Tax=Dryococelus australis TaxID=614101 RepID=A0ABQ9HDA2_9NEOP|nr:hypothetical protein PR048_018541 [Dryococelus australis]